MINPEIGFTSDVIKDPERFVGRTDVIRNCIKSLNSSLGLIAVYGKRGVGKSSLMRQIQQMALGDYTLARKTGLNTEIPTKPRTYLTVYYICDSMISNIEGLLTRLCNDQNDEDGLLRLIPDDGKEITEFTRSKEVHAGADLKVVNWGAKGIESTKYAKIVPNDIVQTFRNYIESIVTHQVKRRMKRDGLLIILDEFDVITDKQGIGSLIKSLSSDSIKFAICGIGSDLIDLVDDHSSVERLIEEGAIHVRPMPQPDIEQILYKAESLFKGNVEFEVPVISRIAALSQGYPYITQLIGKECINQLNASGTKKVDNTILERVLDRIKTGEAFPNLESHYQLAIGNSTDRQILLHLLAEQPEDSTCYNEEVGKVVLKKVRGEAQDLDINTVDQLIPRLIDKRYGPVLVRAPEKPGIYEFVDPVFRIYVTLRNM
ncbi:MAG: hypothetical protein ABFD08_02560 [Syntrophomonas sp.]